MNRYFDNGSTSFPKPPQVADDIHQYLTQLGGTYGRSAYRRVFESTQKVEACRDALAQLFGTSLSENVSFCANATMAINTIIKGLPLSGKTVWVSPLEHNAVMRPLTVVATRNNITIKILPTHPDGTIDLNALQSIDKSDIGLIIINHQSNVSGVIQPIADIARWAADVPVLVDGSQSAGCLPILIDEWGIDYFVFTGHKGLLGPTGIGGFFARHPERLQTLVEGGTGSHSDSFDMPDVMPDRFQAGTPNMVGIIGLLGALEHVPEPQHSDRDVLQLMDNIRALDGYQVIGASDPSCQGHLFSITHSRLSPSGIAQALYSQFGIEVRSGLHCAPAAHQFYHTFPHGTVRIALSPYHTPNDLNDLCQALDKISHTH